MKMKVGKLKEFLSELQNRLEDYEEDQELQLQGNTYFTRHNNYVLQTPTGFLGLDDIDEAINWDDGGED